MKLIEVLVVLDLKTISFKLMTSKMQFTSVDACQNAIQKYPMTQTLIQFLITANSTRWSSGQQRNGVGFFIINTCIRDFIFFNFWWPHDLALKMLPSSPSFFQHFCFIGVHVCDVKKFLNNEHLLQIKYLQLTLKIRIYFFAKAIEAQSVQCCVPLRKVASWSEFLFAKTPSDLIFVGI